MAKDNITSWELRQMNDKIDWIKDILSNHIEKEDSDRDKIMTALAEIRDEFKADFKRLDESKADKRVETVMWWGLWLLFTWMFTTIVYQVFTHIWIK